jgi:hypothetical protein
MVGELRKPFKELEYAWVHGGDGNGLSRAEVTGIQLVPEAERIRYKDLVPVTEQSKLEHLQDVLLAIGSHFIVVADEKSSETGEIVIWDYTFHSSRDKPEETKTLGSAEVDPIIDDPPTG